MRIVPPTVEEIVEEQLGRWRLEREEHRRERRVLPVVALSRQHGAGAGEVALRLSEELGFGLFDREILHRVAESAHLEAQVVEALDERDRESLGEWLLAIGSPRPLSRAGYLDHLTRVVGAIARHGGAVLVGRGAHLILGRAALRVLVVAPLEARIAAVMRRDGLSEEAARRRIAEVEHERSAFLRRHLHAEFADLATFDLAVNTAELGVAGAVAVIRAALAVRFPAGR